MFGHITGEIFNLKPTKTIVKTGGIGFVINSTPEYIQKLRIGSEASFWTHTAVRENSIDLYGFEKEEELRVFELLIMVSGVGPKSALAIIGVAGIRAIEEAVGKNDTSLLTKISGIGRKTAEKIVLELNGKLFAKENKEQVNNDLEVFDALKALGYREKDIQEAMRSIDVNIVNTTDKIKYILKNLGK